MRTEQSSACAALTVRIILTSVRRSRTQEASEMNRTLLSACAATAILGAAGGYAFGVRNNARQLMDIADLREEIAHLQRPDDRPMDHTVTTEQHEEPVADTRRAPAASALEQPTTAPAAKERPSVAPLNPEQKKIRLRQQYGAFFLDMALNEAQASALLEVLSNQARRSEQGERADPERDRRELEAVIGPDKTAEFARLRRTVLARSEVRVIRDRLEDVGLPLSDEQLQKLLADSREREFRFPERRTGENVAAFSARIRSATRELRQQVNDDTGQILTPEQQRQLDSIEDADRADRAHSFANRAPTAVAGSGATP